ncbi:MAG: response regulator [Acidimicrobiales bacterium]
MIRVLLVDDHPVVREGVVAVLGDTAEFLVVGQAGSAEEALEIVRAGIAADVIILDVRLPGMNGIETCATLHDTDPHAQMVIFTSYPNDVTMIEAFSAGAHGFLAKESGAATLQQAVRAVARGETFVDPRLANKLVTMATRGRRARGPLGLTMQEMRVVELLPRGLTNTQIGKELGVTEQTVKTHLHNAMRKLRVRNRAQAAALAQREGLA